jgi:hypothetical protein
MMVLSQSIECSQVLVVPVAAGRALVWKRSARPDMPVVYLLAVGAGVAVCSAFGRYCSGIGEPGNHFS